jgi:hypothetical protein
MIPRHSGSPTSAGSGPPPVRRRRSCSVVALAGILAAQSLAAQEPPEPVESDLRIRSVHAVERPTHMSPASGPPGTLVTLRTSLLPALTPVQVALGGTRSGFEALTLALTDRHGNLVEQVVIPEWARRDGTHRFVVFNAYFSQVYATTGLFHVTDKEGRLLREGEVTQAGPGCPALAGVDNEIYHLQGHPHPLEVGARIVVVGEIVESGECPGGVTLRVASLDPGGG